MAKHDEMTRYAFISHMEDYMKKLLTNPLTADTDEFLKGHGIDGPKAMTILTKRANPEDENSAIVIKKTSIKDNGVDDEGNRLKDTFSVKYRIPRKDYTKKMRNLYISLFESNIVKGSPIEESEDYSRPLSSTPYPFKDKKFGRVQSQCPPGTTGDRFAKYVNDNENDYEPHLLKDKEEIDEGAWGYGVLDNDSALDYQSETTKAYILKVMKDIKNSNDAQGRWAKVGVLVDFLKKYKSDELQVTKEYSEAIDFSKKVLKDLFADESFISSWDDESKIKSSLKKAFNDVSVLRYNEDIMIADDDMPKPLNRGEVAGSPTPNDGKLMEDDEVLEATGCDGSSGPFVTPLFGGPIRRKTMYITQEQADFIKKTLSEEAGNCPVQNTKIGAFGYTAPIGDGKNNKGNDFYKEANDHENMMAKSWKGNMEEEIHIDKENKGKFNATKKRTGKSTEELTHSKNPLTKKRAIFAQNVAKWSKK